MAEPTAVGSTAEHDRLPSLDGLRGLAAVVVLLHHALLVQPALSAPYYGQDVAPSVTWFVATPLHLVWAGGEAVLVFFVLSGFVLARQQTGPRRLRWTRYYPSRLVRLYLPVVVAVLLAAVLASVVPRADLAGRQSEWMHDHRATVTLASVMRNVTLLSPDFLNSPLWSLRQEVVFSLLLPVALVAVLLVRRTWVVGVALAVVVSAVGSTVGNVWIASLPVFLIGCLLAGAHDHRRFRLAGVRGPALAILGALLVTSRWWSGPIADRLPVLVSIAVLVGASLIVVVAVGWASARRVLERRAFQWLGRVSFSLYLVHEPIVVLVGTVVPERSAWVVPVVAVPVALAVAALFFRLVEAPSHRLAKRLQRRRVRADSPV
ncbi:acyltransferase family protein [Curtobacterium luteum]|uniref:acyltransferase family protein n=1 Tax=Curtobacterium luteum TaxID=33881 RepID=UPI003804A791